MGFRRRVLIRTLMFDVQVASIASRCGGIAIATPMPHPRAVRDRRKERTRTPSTSVQPSTVAATNTKHKPRCAFVHALVGPPVNRIIVADRVQLVDRLSAAALLADVEPEGGVRGKPLGVHGFKPRSTDQLLEESALRRR